MTDMVIVISGIFHRLAAGRTVRSVVVSALESFGIGGKLIGAEPDNVLPVLAEQRDERIVGVEDKLSAVADAVLERVENPLGMTVAGKLVAVQVGDHIVSRLYIFESVACKTLVALNKQDIALYLAAECGVAEDESCYTLDLVRAFAVPRYRFSVLAQNMCDHLYGRGLAVRAGNRDNVLGQLHPAENIRAELECDLTREAAALAD